MSKRNFTVHLQDGEPILVSKDAFDYAVSFQKQSLNEIVEEEVSTVSIIFLANGDKLECVESLSEIDKQFEEMED